MKKRFVEAGDLPLMAICFILSDSAPWLYRCFFGWRETNQDGSYFIFSKRLWKIIDEQCKFFFDAEY